MAYKGMIQDLIDKGDRRSYNEIAADIELTRWRQKVEAKRMQIQKMKDAIKRGKEFNKQQAITNESNPETTSPLPDTVLGPETGTEGTH